MKLKQNGKIVTAVAIVAKFLAISMVVLFSFMIIIWKLSDTTVVFVSNDYLLFSFIPFLFGLGAILSFSKEVIGSLLMIVSVVCFNYFGILFEKNFQNFEFSILLIPSITLLIINIIKSRKWIK